MRLFRNTLTILLATLMFYPSFSQSDGFFTRTTSLPYWRHSYDAVITPSNNLFAVGGWDTNDAITSAFRSADSGASWIISVDAVNARAKALDFASVSDVYFVGYNGVAMKSTDAGHNFTAMTLPGSSSSRNFNDVCFTSSNTGFIVGGNESNDAIRTILKTTDAGANWSVIEDNLNPWARGIFFIDSQNGFIVGDQGSIMRTDDGGSTWTEQTAPGSAANRQLHAVHFIDNNTGIIVGGHPDNDSIQTILRTTDGGSTWSLIMDQVGSMLLDVSMRTSTQGYAVGDDGVILETSDGGVSWNELLLGNGVNDSEPLTSVYFKDAYTGVFGGKVGKIIYYIDTTVVLPEPPTVVELLPAELSFGAQAVDGARLTAIVNASNTPSEVYFDLGLDSTATSEYQANPFTLSDSLDQQVSISLFNLVPDETYYYRVRIENEAGYGYSPYKQFYTGSNPIPNWSFEHWDTLTSEVIDNWRSFGDVSKVAGYNGGFATRLQGEGNDSPGAILYGTPGDNGIAGGIPFTERPDSLTGYVQRDIAAGDSAFIVLILKENGNFIVNQMMKFGGSSTGFERFSFPLNYLNGNTPDSLVIGIGSTDVFAGQFDASSVLVIDEINFVNSNQNVPNANMEAWSMVTTLKIQDWLTIEDMEGRPSTTVERWTDAVHESYAISLANDDQNPVNRLALTTGAYQQQPGADFAVYSKHQTLNGYYQFDGGANGDTLTARIYLFENGQVLGYGEMRVNNSVQNWSEFSIPISYFQQGTPDSAKIEFTLSNGNEVGSDSYMAFDNLSFDGFVSEIINSIEQTAEESTSFTVYPNPASDLINIDWMSGRDEPIAIQLYSIDGRLHQSLPSQPSQVGDGHMQIDINDIPSGLYVLIIQQGAQRNAHKIIIQ